MAWFCTYRINNTNDDSLKKNMLFEKKKKKNDTWVCAHCAQILSL